MNIVTCFPLTEALTERIRRAFPQGRLIPADQETVARQIFDADIFCGHGRHQQIDWPAVAERGRLKWIQSSAAGLDHCLTPAVIESDIVVSGCTGLFRDSVAEQTMALLYGLVRNLPRFFLAQQKREFIRRPTDDLHGKTIGIAGFGGNGQRIAELLAPLGSEIIATERFVDEWKAVGGLPPVSEIVPAGRLNEMLERSDVVILTLPLDKSTRKIIGEPELKRMPRGSRLINVGRGQLVDEPALVAALRDGHLAGAGLDVTFTEPLPAESPLWSEPGVIISPHVGAQSSRRYELVTELFIENLKRFSTGKKIRNLVDKQVGYPLPADRY